MASLVLSGDTSGSVTLAAPAVAGSTTQTLPAASGTIVVGSAAVSAVGQIPFSTDGTTYTPTAKIVSDTAVDSTSGTSIDFTGIPSWAKRITVMFRGVSLSGSSDILVQVGSGSITNTGYLSNSGQASTGGTTSILASTAGFAVSSGNAARLVQGALQIFSVDGTQVTSSGALIAGATVVSSAGSVTLGGAIDRVRITTVNGTDTFDAGTINILYE
jgi:hypothetical protein